MSFSFYVEPGAVLKDRQANHLIVGLGSDGDLELAFVNIGDGYRHDADLLLTKEQLAQAIKALSDLYDDMEES